MLNSFKIKNFKKFAELDLQNFSRVNVFVGNNNSGKSTVLEAINLALSEQLMQAFSRCFRLGDFGVQFQNEIEYLFNSVNHDIELSFKYKDVEHQVKITQNIDTAKLLSLNINAQNGFFKPLLNYFYDNQEPTSLMYNQNQNNLTFAGLISNKLCVTSFFNTNLTWFHNAYQEIQITKKDHLILNFLQQLDERIVALTLTNNELYVDVGLEKLIPLRYLGDGIIKIIGILAWVINTTNGIVLVDEIENGIYYKNISKLIQYLDQISSQLNVQLFITTHSEDFIRKIEGFSDLSFYRLNPKFDGGVMCWDRNKTVSYTQDNSIDVR